MIPYLRSQEHKKYVDTYFATYFDPVCIGDNNIIRRPHLHPDMHARLTLYLSWIAED